MTEADRQRLIPLETLRSLSGIELLRGMMEGRYPAPPFPKLLGFRIIEVEPGRVVFAATPTIDHYNPLGTVHGGYFATILDSCMACAVQTNLQAGTGYTTLEFKVNLVRAMTVETGEVRAEGRVLSAGRRIATSEGRLVDAAGKLLAHATTTCLIFEN